MVVMEDLLPMRLCVGGRRPGKAEGDTASRPLSWPSAQQDRREAPGRLCDALQWFSRTQGAQLLALFSHNHLHNHPEHI